MDSAAQAVRECMANGQPVERDTEYLELVRFGDPGYQDLLQDLLRQKYGHGHRPVDVVIPVFPPTIKFFLTYGESILPEVPVLICGELAGYRQNAPVNPQVNGPTLLRPKIRCNDWRMPHPSPPLMLPRMIRKLKKGPTKPHKR